MLQDSLLINTNSININCCIGVSPVIFQVYYGCFPWWGKFVFVENRKKKINKLKTRDLLFVNLFDYIKHQSVPVLTQSNYTNPLKLK